jgi:hypothetical protein
MPPIQPWPKQRRAFFEKWQARIGTSTFAEDLTALINDALVAGADRARDRFVRELYAAAAEYDAMAHEDPSQRDQYRTIAARIRDIGTVLETLTARDLSQVVKANPPPSQDRPRRDSE